MLLVKHYMNLEQPNNALNVYQQCEDTFKAELGIQLSPKMQKLAAQFLKPESGKENNTVGVD